VCSSDLPDIDSGLRYGFFKEKDGRLTISNKIFEILISTFLITREKKLAKIPKIHGLREVIIQNGRFNMEKCLQIFSEKYQELYKEKNTKFLEEHGKMLFLMYLIPLINGVGRYYIETETLNENRMDLVINYNGEEFILELKIWKGKKYQKDGHKQLLGYMDSRTSETGYLLTFDFRQQKTQKEHWIASDSKKIFEIII
jgi:hypothetical protein